MKPRTRPPQKPRPRRRDDTGGLTIVHEDDQVLVIDKPPGVITANAPGEHRDSVFDAVKALARRRAGRTARAFIVHRLDKEASGLLVFAKTEGALTTLKDELRLRRVHRLYLAVVEGEVRDAQGELPRGTIQTYMIDEDDEGLARSVPLGDVAREGKRRRAARPPARATDRPGPPQRDEPRLAVTHYRVLGAGNGRSLVQLRLETGRKNQIRVHMKEWGHPIIGDLRYGAATDPIGRMALHASELGFTSPASRTSVRYVSPAPESFYRAVGLAPPAVPGVHAPPEAPRGDAAETSWENVASWYADLIAQRGNDLYEQVIAPGVLRLVAPRRGMRILDVACGQGDLARRMASEGAQVVGVDASPTLIEAAAAREGPLAPRFMVGDARSLLEPGLGLERGTFDAVTCVMALMNIDPVEPLFEGAAALLAPGGTFTAVLLHPAFRSPGQTSWAWDEPPATRTRAGTRGGPPDRRTDAVRQYRRVDAYLSHARRPIVMNPGDSARGNAEITTLTFHRPIQAYVAALSNAGLLIRSIQEWASPRTSQPGPRAAEENRARAEIPMFLAIQAVRPRP